jgi:DNA modification methylase
MPRTPKRGFMEKKGKSAFYDFYPGFSAAFVEDVLHYFNINKDSVILDPWNGSGTTTYVAAKNGYKAIGYDINPVMYFVAKARDVSPSSMKMLKKTYLDILHNIKPCEEKLNLEIDPLSDWLTKKTVNVIRAIEYSIQNTLLNKSEYTPLYIDRNKMLSLTTTSAFFYLALFRVLKEISHVFRSSNPTWIKKPKTSFEKRNYSRDYLINSFKKQVEELLDFLEQEEVNEHDNQTLLGIESSSLLPLENECIDIVITSPPYCTRIDYAILTSLELSLLGFSKDDIKNLRRNLIGSPVMWEEVPKINKKWGSYCLEIIDLIKNHPSKASETYYLRTYLQYFNSIYTSLKEINRVLKNNGKCVFVVQNSYYKDIYINLAKIFIDMAKSLNWKIIEEFVYSAKQNMININTKSNLYRFKGTKENEYVLIFEKEGI